MNERQYNLTPPQVQNSDSRSALREFLNLHPTRQAGLADPASLRGLIDAGVPVIVESPLIVRGPRISSEIQSIEDEIATTYTNTPAPEITLESVQRAISNLRMMMAADRMGLPVLEPVPGSPSRNRWTFSPPNMETMRFAPIITSGRTVGTSFLDGGARFDIPDSADAAILPRSHSRANRELCCFAAGDPYHPVFCDCGEVFLIEHPNIAGHCPKCAKVAAVPNVAEELDARSA